MHLAGQGEIVWRRDERGYAMAALIVGLAVMAVLMTVAMPVWKQTVQREKEAELVFRGEQYAHAIGMFQRKDGECLPPESRRPRAAEISPQEVQGSGDE